MIENFLEFSGISYDFFDIYDDSLTQAVLDSYDGVILEGHSMYFFATTSEQQLIRDNMEAGAISVFLSLIHGQYTSLDSTIYGAIDVEVDGLGNQEADIHLLEGATNAYDYAGDGGFVVIGGTSAKHVGLTVLSMGLWSSVCEQSHGERQYGLEFALETWMESAFGADARVTIPVISLRLDDTQTTVGERHQSVIDFMDSNRHRIRASGFLVTDASAYQVGDSTLVSDEQIISSWGSMSLHGKDHGDVGAEGEDRDYATQYSDMQQAVSFLAEHFPSYEAIKASPSNSWNEATLHAMYDTGIYYHTACYRKSPEYRALYESVFDADTDMERQKLKLRGEAGELGYYPLKHSDDTGVAEIYSVDWGPLVSGTMASFQVLPLLKAHALDWWTPICVGSHYYSPTFGGANMNPLGWTQVMEELMEIVDRDTYCWRRWVDTYDLAVNVERFDRALAINSITVSGDLITYDITASEPIKFMTLRAHRDGYRIGSVTMGGQSYSYFGTDYVHLAEMAGNAVIQVALTNSDDVDPHVTHVDPTAFVEDAACDCGRLHLEMCGDSNTMAHVEASSNVFRYGLSRVYADNSLDLEIDVSSSNQTDQIDMALQPPTGSVEVIIDVWDTSGTCYRQWTEVCTSPAGMVDHWVGDLAQASEYLIRVEGAAIDTCLSDASGRIHFAVNSTASARTFEILEATSAGSGEQPPESGNSEWWASGHMMSVSPVPSSGVTLIRYLLRGPERVTLGIYDVSGRLVRVLVSDYVAAGEHRVTWDGTDSSGNTVGAGVYFCRFEAGQYTATRRMVLLK